MTELDGSARVAGLSGVLMNTKLRIHSTDGLSVHFLQQTKLLYLQNRFLLRIRYDVGSSRSTTAYG